MNLHDQTMSLIQQVKNRWDLIQYVTVLDHPTTAFGYSVSLVASSVQTVKSLIPKKLKITVPDDWTAYYTHPDLCHVGQDFLIAAVQPVYYSVGVDGAGPLVLSSRKNVSDTCHRKYVQIVGYSPVGSGLIVDAGWPDFGGPNFGGNMTDPCAFAGQSPECQYRAVTGMINALSGDVILYEAFDDLWKFDPSHRQYDKYFVISVIVSANDRDCIRVRRRHEISSKLGATRVTERDRGMVSQIYSNR